MRMLITESGSDHETTRPRRRRDGFSHHQASGWSIALRYVSITTRMTSSTREHDPAASRQGQSRIPEIRPVIGDNYAPERPAPNLSWLEPVGLLLEAVRLRLKRAGLLGPLGTRLDLLPGAIRRGGRPMGEATHLITAQQSDRADADRNFGSCRHLGRSWRVRAPIRRWRRSGTTGLSDCHADALSLLRSASGRDVVDSELAAGRRGTDIGGKSGKAWKHLAVDGNDFIACVEPGLCAGGAALDLRDPNNIERHAAIGDLLRAFDVQSKAAMITRQRRSLLRGQQLVAHLVLGECWTRQALRGEQGGRDKSRQHACHLDVAFQEDA